MYVCIMAIMQIVNRINAAEICNTNTLNILEFVLFANDTTILYSSESIVTELPVINEPGTFKNKWLTNGK